MYACGGPKKLERTGSQAEIILHSRIFYYQSTTGIAISLIGYKRWLRAQSFERVKPWEWTILDMLCQKRDQAYAKKVDGQTDNVPGVQDTAKAQHEKDVWIHELYNGDLYDPAPHEIQAKQKMDGNAALQSEPEHEPSLSAPTWQTAAPKAELYVDRRTSANEESGKGQTGDAPYPVRFAQIIEAIQKGKPVEGIQEIPDTVARNPVGNLRQTLTKYTLANKILGYSPVRYHDCPQETLGEEPQGRRDGRGARLCRHREGFPRRRQERHPRLGLLGRRQEPARS